MPNKKMKNRIFTSVDECNSAIDRYFDEYLKLSGEVADIESLADYLSVTRDDVLALMHDKKYGDIFRRARNRIAKIKKQLAFNGKIPAAVLSFDLKNNHGYRDKPEDSEAMNAEGVVFKGRISDWAQ